MHQGKIIGLTAVVMLAACHPAPAGDAGSQNSGSPVAAVVVSHVPMAESSNEASPLLSVLMLFGSEQGALWNTYDALAGVTWLDKAPSEYADGKYTRGGRLLLAGFGSAKLPNGMTGSEYGTVEGNEGQSGVTLNGDADRVQTLSIKKFYFSEDYQGILQRQVSAVSSVRRIADACTPEEDAEVPGNNVFFEVGLAGRPTVYAEVFLEAGGKYSPGYTVFDFQRDKPTARIAELGCRAL